MKKAGYRRLLNKLMIRFFDLGKEWNGKAVFYHLDENRFYLRDPRKHSYNYVEITRWWTKKNSDGLWVGLVWGKNKVIVDSKQIIALAEQLKFLQGIDNENFDIKK